MGYDIVIGSVSLDTAQIIKDINECGEMHSLNFSLSVLPCEGEEPKGLTQIEFAGVDCGQPVRSPSYTGWYDFSVSHTCIAELMQDITPNGSDGYTYPLNTPVILDKLPYIEAIICNLSPINADRAKWLCFWIRKAVELYSNNAVIQFN